MAGSEFVTTVMGGFLLPFELEALILIASIKYSFRPSCIERRVSKAGPS
jgi:hypothetical protein